MTKPEFLQESDLDHDYIQDDDYSAVNRNNDNAMNYFLKFILVLGGAGLIYMYLTGKL
ncbi:MAG TPA: hypothetical protein PKW54_04730 [Ferruginibacter sp.]|nr:hypothetical protein [Ferruginibacter sp.]